MRPIFYSYSFKRTVARFFVISFFFLTSCKQSQQPELQAEAQATEIDSIDIAPVSDSEIQREFSEEVSADVNDIIDYNGIISSVRMESKLFKPFEKLRRTVSYFIRSKDSLREAGIDALKVGENKVYQEILNYKLKMESGSYTDESALKLLDMVRHVGDSDSSLNKLPEIQGASFFAANNFFFLGGAPFIDKAIEYDSATHQEQVFKDANGNPELRFQVVDTENMYYLFNSVMKFKRPRVKITFGGPVEAYDGPPDEVKGIGSVIHNFQNNIPALFLTENGLIAARLLYYQEPFTEQYSCYSNYPRVVFACSTNIEPDQILGIFIPYDDHHPAICSVNTESKWLWTADLNGDAIPDLACAIGTFEGILSDPLIEILWYANVNGEWQIIEYASEPSCT